jgi:guanylate kinase
MEQCPGSISFFVHPGSLDELENRLRRRATDSEEAILRRLQVAADELRAIQRYRYEIINREVEQSVTEICQRLQNHNQEGSNARST